MNKGKGHVLSATKNKRRDFVVLALALALALAIAPPYLLFPTTHFFGLLFYF